MSNKECAYVPSTQSKQEAADSMGLSISGETPGEQLEAFQVKHDMHQSWTETGFAGIDVGSLQGASIKKISEDAGNVEHDRDQFEFEERCLGYPYYSPHYFVSPDPVAGTQLDVAPPSHHPHDSLSRDSAYVDAPYTSYLDAAWPYSKVSSFSASPLFNKYDRSENMFANPEPTDAASAATVPSGRAQTKVQDPDGREWSPVDKEYTLQQHKNTDQPGQIEIAAASANSVTETTAPIPTAPLKGRKGRQNAPGKIDRHPEKARGMAADRLGWSERALGQVSKKCQG